MLIAIMTMFIVTLKILMLIAIPYSRTHLSFIREYRAEKKDVTQNQNTESVSRMDYLHTGTHHLRARVLRRA